MFADSFSAAEITPAPEGYHIAVRRARRSGEGCPQCNEGQHDSNGGGPAKCRGKRALFQQVGGPVGGLQGVIQQAEVAGGVIGQLLQGGDVHRREDLDLGAGGPVGILAGLLHQTAVGFGALGKDIPAGDELGKGTAIDLDGAVGEIDAGDEPFQAGKTFLQLPQQGGGVFGGLFALLHQGIIAQTVTQLLDAAVEVGALL